jgi:hypothetical protein
MATGTLNFSGRLTTRVITAAERERAKRREILKWKVRHFFVQRWREMPLEVLLLVSRFLARVVPGFNIPMHGRLYMKVDRNGETWDYGCVGVHLIVTAGKNYVAACFDNTSEPELLKFHGFGTGTTAAAAGDTALGTELTTQYATDSTRPTGTTEAPRRTSYTHRRDPVAGLRRHDRDHGVGPVQRQRRGHPVRPAGFQRREPRERQ